MYVQVGAVNCRIYITVSLRRTVSLPARGGDARLTTLSESPRQPLDGVLRNLSKNVLPIEIIPPTPDVSQSIKCRLCKVYLIALNCRRIE